MIIRRAEKRDVERLVGLMGQLGYKVSQGALEENLHSYGSAVLVAEMHGRAVGCLAYHILPQFHSEERFMRIVSLVVDEIVRGMGIGKRLLREAEAIASTEGCSVIELTSGTHRIESGAHAFYQAQGYLAEGQKVYFRKELSS